MHSLIALKQAMKARADVPELIISPDVIVSNFKIHHVDMAMIMMDLEEGFKIQINDEKFNACSTIGDVVDYLNEERGITIALDEARSEGRRLLGDAVTDVLDKVGIAAQI